MIYEKLIITVRYSLPYKHIFFKNPLIKKLVCKHFCL